MNLTCDRRSDDWDLLALGSVDETAAEEMRAHLRSGCVDCLRIYAGAVEAGLVLASAGVEANEPSDAVRLRLAAYTKAGGKLVTLPIAKQRNRWSVAAGWWAAAACAVVAVWLGKENWELRQRAILERVVSEPKIAVSVGPAVAQSSGKDSSGNERELRTQISLLEEHLRNAESRAGALVEELNAKLALQGREGAELKATLEGLRAEKERDQIAFAQKLRSVEQERSAKEQRVAELTAEMSAGGGKRDAELASLQAKLNEGRRDLERQGALLEEYRSAFRALEAGGAKQVEFTAVDAAAGKGQVRAIYSPQGGLLLLARDLPVLAPTKCYQLWILRKGNPSIVSGGLVRVDGAGKGFLVARPSAALEGATGFALTDEPAGGSVSARGKKLLFGAI